MRAVFFVMFCAVTSSAAAETCWFVDPAGDRLTFLHNGENELIIQRASGTETCSYGMDPELGGVIGCGETGLRGPWERTGPAYVDLQFDGKLWSLNEDCRNRPLDIGVGN